MRLIIDQGNSAMKLSIFDKGAVVARAVLEEGDAVEFVSKTTAGRAIESAIYCSVRRAYDEALVAWLQAHTGGCYCFDEHTRLPIAIAYRTPHTLGYDRIAAAVGAQAVCPGRNVLVIDAGTAITYDLLLADGTYVGGNIAPGADLRLQSLHEHTGRLPLVGTAGDTPLIGYDTTTALRAGSLQGIVHEIEGYTRALAAQYSDLLVFLTGGDAPHLAAMTKKTIFALDNGPLPATWQAEVTARRQAHIILDTNLVPKGLNRILEYNVKK